MVHTFAQVEMASENRSCQTARPFLSFSIDRILNGQFKTERERLKKHHRTVAATQKKIKEMQESNGKMVGNFLQKYEWLQFTRYNPPKLPSTYEFISHALHVLFIILQGYIATARKYSVLTF